MIDCDEAERRLQRYLDRELAPAEVADVQLHLNQCENCRVRYRFEANLKRLVRASGAQPVAPPDLQERIRQRLRLAGDG